MHGMKHTETGCTGSDVTRYQLGVVQLVPQCNRVNNTPDE